MDELLISGKGSDKFAYDLDLPNPFIQEILDSFKTVRFFLMYGQTEATARLSYLPPERLEDKLGSIGKGLPSTRLEVLRDDGKQCISSIY